MAVCPWPDSSLYVKPPTAIQIVVAVFAQLLRFLEEKPNGISRAVSCKGPANRSGMPMKTTEAAATGSGSRDRIDGDCGKAKAIVATAC
jgi:hypothetical protein